MPRDARTLLGFDTSAAHCAAALLSDGAVHGARHLEMGRGQAEHLMPLLQEVLDEQGLDWPDLDGLAVGIGPGNFTGIRISVSAARGLALALDLPVFGISTFELMRDPDNLDAHPAEIVSVPAPRGQAYVQHFSNGAPQGAPRQIDPDHPPQDLMPPGTMRVRGFRAADIARPFGAVASDAAITDIGPRLLRCAAWRWQRFGTPTTRPAPLYVRPADAAPPSDPPPVILDDA